MKEIKDTSTYFEIMTKIHRKEPLTSEEKDYKIMFESNPNNVARYKKETEE